MHRMIEAPRKLALAAAFVLGAGFAADFSASAAPLSAALRFTSETTAHPTLQPVRGRPCPEPCPDCADCDPEIEPYPARPARRAPVYDDPIAREIERIEPVADPDCETDSYVERRRTSSDNAGMCGIRCWYWRLRNGYCGPGCEYYNYRMFRHNAPGGSRVARHACRN
jgi:hypothetical protein